MLQVYNAYSLQLYPVIASSGKHTLVIAAWPRPLHFCQSVASYVEVQSASLLRLALAVRRGTRHGGAVLVVLCAYLLRVGCECDADVARVSDRLADGSRADRVQVSKGKSVSCNVCCACDSDQAVRPRRGDGGGLDKEPAAN